LKERTTVKRVGETEKKKKKRSTIVVNSIGR